MKLSTTAAAVSVAAALSGSSVVAGPADELITQGDVYYNRLDEQNSLKYFLPAEKLDPNNAELLVKISREYRHLMGDTPKIEEKLRLGKLATDYAERAVKVAPQNSDAHLAVAICYGKVEPLESSAEKLEASRVIKSEVDEALKLDPSSDIAWHILGRWNMGFAEITGVKRALAAVMYGKLPETTFEEAAHCYEKAIALKPDRLMHYIELGRCYARMGHVAEAREMIKKGLAMKDTEKDDPETKRIGQEELAKLPPG